jgi:hypothetical protein
LHHPEYRERYAANLRRELPHILFAACHPEAAESSASPRAPNEGPMQLAGTTTAHAIHSVDSRGPPPSHMLVWRGHSCPRLSMITTPAISAPAFRGKPRF